MNELIKTIGAWTYRFVWDANNHLIEIDRPLRQIVSIDLDRESFMSCLRTIMFVS